MATFGHKGRLRCVPVLENVGVQIGSPLALAFVACLAEDARLARLLSWLAPLGVQSPSLMLRGLSNGCLVVGETASSLVVPMWERPVCGKECGTCVPRGHQVFFLLTVRRMKFMR